MPALRQPSRIPRAAAWRLFFCLAVVAFLLRATIPAGYMPAANAAGSGVGALSFCPGAAGAGVASDHPADGLAHPVDGHHDYQSCPFCIAASHAMAPAPLSLAFVGVAALLRLMPLPTQGRVGTAAVAAGPPLGSRAPPQHLA